MQQPSSTHPLSAVPAADPSPAPEDRWPAVVRSFDIFDTVLTRAVGSPVAVFRALGDRLREQGIVPAPPSTVAVAREQVERRLTQWWGASVALVDIHAELALTLGYGPDTATRVLELELEVERGLSRLVPGAHERLRAARGPADDPVVFVSDTPLPESFLIELLRRQNAWRDGDAVFSSADMRATKANGGLFSIVQEALGLPASRFLHTGDNVMSDVAAARVAGWRAGHAKDGALTRYEERLEQHVEVSDGLSSFLAGASRLARLEGVQRGIDPALAAVTAGVAAPMLLSFGLWLLRQAQAKGLRRLYFVSRDGEAMLEALAPLLAALDSDIDCRYLYGSRRAWNLASFAAADDRDTADWLADGRTYLTPRAVLAKLGLSAERAHELTGHRFFSAESTDRILSAAERAELFAATDTPVFLAEIAKVAKVERSNVLAYLSQEGVGDGTPAGLVDVGWEGITSRSLDDLMVDAGLRPLDAYFYIGLHEMSVQRSGPRLAERQTAYLFDRARRRGVALEVPDVVSLVEMFCAGSHGTVRGFRHAGDRVEPVLASPLNQGVIDWGLHDYRWVLRRAAEHFAGGTGHLERMADLRPAVAGVLRDFWERPSTEEVRVWGRFPYDTDRYPISVRPIAEPITTSSVVDVLKGGQLRLRQNDSWQAGTARVSRQPWSGLLAAIAAYRRHGPRVRRIPRRLRLEAALRRGHPESGSTRESEAASSGVV